MYSFNYLKASSLSHAADAVARDPDAKLLAGGQTLIAAMKIRLAAPSTLIDLRDLPELRGVRADANTVTIGAMTCHQDVATSAEVRKTIPALAELAGDIGDRMVRNMGTLGGSIANSDPSADYPAAVLGLGATVNTDRRQIQADEFFLGMFETALQAGEIITSVTFPVPKRAAYCKFKNQASRYAIVGVFVADTGSGVRVAVTGAAGSVFRARDMESALGNSFSPDALNGIQVDSAAMNSDLHASAEYRAHLVTVMAKRAIEKASARS